MTRVLMFALALVSTQVFAAEPANFTGEWKLDKSRSDTLEPMLERCGLGWIERKAAISFPSTVSIVHNGDNVHITNHTIVSDVVTLTILDDKKHPVKTPLGPMLVKAKRLDGGATVFAETWTQCERNDVKMVMTNTRRYTKGTSEMTLVMDVTKEDGKHVKMRRLFVRQKK